MLVKVLLLLAAMVLMANARQGYNARRWNGEIKDLPSAADYDSDAPYPPPSVAPPVSRVNEEANNNDDTTTVDYPNSGVSGRYSNDGADACSCVLPPHCTPYQGTPTPNTGIPHSGTTPGYGKVAYDGHPTSPNYGDNRPYGSWTSPHYGSRNLVQGDNDNNPHGSAD